MAPPPMNNLRVEGKPQSPEGEARVRGSHVSKSLDPRPRCEDNNGFLELCLQEPRIGNCVLIP